MKLATEIRWQETAFTVPADRIVASERWGYDAVFTAEGLGSDALTPLGYVAAITNRLQLGTCIAQVTGRSPATTAMSFLTLDAMTGGGRLIAGLGSSNPVLMEGLHGRPWGSAYWRMRDYVALLRSAFAGRPLARDGRAIALPFRGDGNIGAPAMPIALTPDPSLPIILAAATPTMITLAAEVADGWFPVNYAPGIFGHIEPLLQEGFRRAGGSKSLDDFDIWVHADVIVDDDVRAAMRPFKEYVASWAELQRQQIEWRGYGDLADRLIELVHAGRFDAAVDAVPDDYIDEGWLVGPLDRVLRRIEPWLDCGATGLIVRSGNQMGPAQSPEDLDVFRAIAKHLGKPGHD